VPFSFVQYVPLKLSTHILHFLSQHLAVFVHPALLLLPSVLPHLYSLLKLLIVFQCLLSIITVTQFVL